MNNITKQLSEELRKIRLTIKRLSEEQIALKKLKKATKDQAELSELQARIYLKRTVLSMHYDTFNEIKAKLSEFPYGQSNLSSKMNNLSKEIAKINEIYQSLTFKQHQLKQALSIGLFLNKEAISQAQQEKAMNVLDIKKVTDKRSKLKTKFKTISDMLFAEKKANSL